MGCGQMLLLRCSRRELADKDTRFLTVGSACECWIHAACHQHPTLNLFDTKLVGGSGLQSSNSGVHEVRPHGQYSMPKH